MALVKTWIKALRLRTLPLAIASTTLGSAAAFYHGKLNFMVGTLAAVTAVLLQILSNLSNDLGDSIKGTDNNQRIGPLRTVQSGAVTRKQMKKAIAVNILLILIAGISLIIISFKPTLNIKLLMFFVLGLLAIYSAVKYTMGSKPYGYAGLGDAFVFIWFGVVAVAGTYYLHMNTIGVDVILLSVSLGFLSVCVLNLNNLRDRENDALSGKRTLIVRYGQRMGKIYQALLVLLAFICAQVFVLFNFSILNQALLTMPFVFLFLYTNNIIKIREALFFDPYLKKFSVGTFVFSISLQMGLILSYYA